MQKDIEASESHKGLYLAIVCYVMWGLFPLYWKLLKDVPSMLVLANRILWSAIFLSVFCIINNRKLFIQIITNKTNVMYMALAGMLIALNWGTFIYAVNNNYLIESSIGYYINPLVNIVMGLLFFKERLNFYEKLSGLLAFIGVAYMAFSHGKIPLIALILAFSFSLYGVIKKKAALPVAPALALENILIMPLVLAFLSWNYIETPSVYTNLKGFEVVLLIFGGLITAIPLLMFAKAVKLINYTTIGFLQYIAPTLQLFCAIIIFKEKFTLSHWICFGFIWSGLTVFTFNIIRKNLKKNT